jgi:SAM-dependent methyltransferase
MRACSTWGVGTGLASEPLAREGALITGIDPAGEMLRYAKVRLPRAQLVQGRAEALPFPTASFDAAIAADVFHLLDGPAAIGELVRVVRKGGLVAVWWQTLSTESDILGHRAGATHDTGLDPVPEPLAAPCVRSPRSFARPSTTGWAWSARAPRCAPRTVTRRDVGSTHSSRGWWARTARTTRRWTCVRCSTSI